VLTGALPSDGGQIYLDGQPVIIDSPRRALDLGITMIHQELALIPQLTVGQNIYLGREPRLAVRSMVDWKTLYENARAELDRLGLDIPVRAIISELSIAQRQLVEIAKALSYQARLIVLDEPTSALTERETDTLFALMRALRDQGVTLIFISHRLEEVFALADRIAVMRDGRLVGVAPASELDPAAVVQWMVGRELREYFPRGDRDAAAGERAAAPLLQARGLKLGKELRGVDLDLFPGEIVGVSGLVGAGRTNLARALVGADRIEAGSILIDGQPVHIRSPQDAVRLGIGFLPEDRKAQGLFLGQSVRTNTAVSVLDRFSHLGFLNFPGIERIVAQMIEKLDIRTPSQAQRVRNLSGGNQQKVVFARWLALNPKILILDEPTRGVDVAAKAEIHALMVDMANQGIAILMISSELPEILGISDRVLVMREGKIVAQFDRSQATQTAIMHAATGQV